MRLGGDVFSDWETVIDLRAMCDLIEIWGFCCFEWCLIVELRAGKICDAVKDDEDSFHVRFNSAKYKKMLPFMDRCIQQRSPHIRRTLVE